ncbi:hypothetical protein GOP47_0015529 [Adiantum capillus-veneris]|uniref:GIR1-like zinc ribbon domain-containing protein n=1 Tax=Adiantum capillus-veneris TaxID=13818 RepID=A0A9D4UL03_ADICA|nr:hypothetical protein GOP47_0015529 [Adiantum capillus-veneris]
MGETISWIAVNKSGEVCLDSDLPPLPRGWERCLDLQSGVMYLKQMNPQPGESKSGGIGQSRATTHKRQRVLLGNDDGEGDPTLQLSLSLPSSTNTQSHPSNPSSLSDANSIVNNELKYLSCQREDATTANSPPQNASSSSSSSSPPSKLGSKSNVGLRSNQLNEEKSLIRAAGCPHCFMYVLPSKSNPKCPRCKSSILVDLSPLTIH